ncbi:MAG TPA: uracil-DNA glycosylase [Bacteriovoracaceae bacterium]|nr:uracil-DNA glycosylase [Bacteriovoracaceae bacterium]
MAKTWETELEDERQKPYYKELMKFLDSERKKKKIIYPPESDIFNALKLTPLKNVKVVILGQDPYHGPGQAHGLAFSVQRGVKIPPSLQNIFKELKSDLIIDPPEHGNLEAWAMQGVLLLNNVLTVENGKPASHHGKGWEIFTDRIIEILNEEKKNLVFILWGSPAQKKARVVSPEKHLMLTSSHPSPLSSYRGFFGSKPFSRTNAYLASKDIKEINWQL